MLIYYHVQVQFCHMVYPQEYENWVAGHPFADTPEFKNWFGQVVCCPDKLECGAFIAMEVNPKTRSKLKFPFYIFHTCHILSTS